MGRIVTAVVTYGSTCVGVVGPFHVDIPWWAEVEPVVARMEETLGVPVVVLRLLTVEGADGARGGHVTYHVQALQSSGNLTACDDVTGAATANGTTVKIWTCNGGANQRWHREARSFGRWQRRVEGGVRRGRVR